ncbi:SCO family protein [Deinococcus multiflagellatus]|uniref:SCO family protein n=1 Tax=Deinococcus multiflagellatus TaxID=1656887 RepID=UPI001CCD16F1|nr:SCO family protein [Deinococcus multiflagellatus]MBZ9713124.1 SCO family protein [Deinococcus multiflagellatus]
MTAPAHPADPAGPATRPWYVSAGLALAAVALLLGLAWGAARLRSPYPFYGTAYPAGTQAAPFQGVAVQGGAARPFAFTPGAGGQATALFFGFTHCASICPLSLSYLNKARALLPAELQAKLQIVLVSVDPARDTPARLNDYVSYFGSGTGVRVPEPALTQVARAYGVAYQKAEVQGAAYQINHTTATYLIDARGHLRVLWDYTQLPQVERVKADLQYVLETP